MFAVIWADIRAVVSVVGGFIFSPWDKQQTRLRVALQREKETEKERDLRVSFARSFGYSLNRENFGGSFVSIILTYRFGDVGYSESQEEEEELEDEHWECL